MTRQTLSLVLAGALGIITTTHLDAEQQRRPATTTQVTSVPAQRAGRTGPSPSSAPTAKPAGFTNRDVILMVEAGLSDSLIATSISRATVTNFQLDAAGLIALKQAGVSEAVITLMLNPKTAVDAGPSSAAPTARVVVPSTPVPPSAAALLPGGAALDIRTRTENAASPVEVPRDPGLYVDLGRTGPNLVALEPTTFSQGKTGGVLMSAMTGGIAKAKWKAVVRAPRAVQRIPTATPTFYFYFEHRSSGLGSALSGWMQGATSPNEFVLARMTTKSNERELIVGEAGRFGASTGTRSKDTVEFTVEKLAGGAYRVTPAEPLTIGEYAFFYATAASTPGAAAAGKLFDFGVDSPTSVR